MPGEADRKRLEYQAKLAVLARRLITGENYQDLSEELQLGDWGRPEWVPVAMNIALRELRAALGFYAAHESWGPDAEARWETALGDRGGIARGVLGFNDEGPRERLANAVADYLSAIFQRTNQRTGHFEPSGDVNTLDVAWQLIERLGL